MARLIKVAEEKIIQERVPAVAGTSSVTTKYIGQYDGFWDSKKLRGFMASYNYFFGSPPKSWYNTSKKQLGRAMLTPDLVFDENGNGTTIHWVGEQKPGF